jgi:hypothetical protein
LAEKPTFHKAGRLHSRLPIPKSLVSFYGGLGPNVEMHPVDALHLQGPMPGENIGGAARKVHGGLRVVTGSRGHTTASGS